MIDPVAERGTGVDNWIGLEAAIERGRMDLRKRALAEGVNIGDPVEYRVWLEAGLLEPDREAVAV